MLRYYTIFESVSLQNTQPLIANHFERSLLEAKSIKAKRLLDILHRSTRHAKIVAGAISVIQRISALAEILVLTHINIRKYVCNICPNRNVYKYSHQQVKLIECS